MKKTLPAKIFLFCFALITSQAMSQGWSGLGTGVTAPTNGTVRQVVVWGGNVYVAGQFTTVGGSVAASNIAMWNGTTQTWSALGSGITGTSAEVKALCVYNNALYVGGTFTNAGGVATSNIAKWSGSAWSVVGAASGTDQLVNAMIVFNSKLYVGGAFLTAGGVSSHYVGVWDGTAWATSTGAHNYVNCFGIFNSELYAGVQGGFVLEKLVGITWTQASSLNNNSYYMTSLCAYNSFLYCSGVFTTGPIQNLAKFNGTQFSAIATGKNTPLVLNASPLVLGYANAMKVFNNKLWVGGSFVTADGVSSPYLAAWSSVSGSFSSAYVSPTALNSTVFGIDTGSTGVPSTQYIYVGGAFTTPFNRVMRGVINVGVEEVAMADGMISVYPNPAHGRLNIRLNPEIKNPSVEIYNILGSKIYSEAIKSEQAAISTKEFSPGVYLVKVISSENDGSSVKVSTQKVVIE